MNASEQRFWLCWSPRQNRFHIEPEAVGVRTNYGAFKRNAVADYVPIAVFDSREQANKAARDLWSVLDEREKLFGSPGENGEN